jgi:exodeoxyribonuclease III
LPENVRRWRKAGTVATWQPMSDTLKIASWNINSVRIRMDLVARFVEEAAPDVICFQETKTVDRDFPSGLFRQLGYNHQVLHGMPAYHGVAIVSRVPLREDQRFDWQDNGEARHVGVMLDCGLRIENVYVPAGGDVPDPALNPKFGQKLAFLERMTRWSERLRTPTLLLGDFNVAPLPCDVWSHKQLIDTVSHTEVEVNALDQLQASHDWVDLGRRFTPAPERLHTWWSYRAQDWAKSDRGRRLDHMWASPPAAAAAIGHTVFEPCRGWARPSDHVPIMTEFNL